MTDPTPPTSTGQPGAEELRRATATVRFATALRRLRDRLSSDQLSVAELHEAAAEAEALAIRLHAPEPEGDPAHIDIEWGAPGTHPVTSPYSGVGNAVAPPLVYDRDTPKDLAVATCTLSQAFGGMTGYSHGGLVAAAFDDVLGRVGVSSGHGGPTGTLIVKYRAPVPLHRELRFEGRLDRIEGRKVFVSGTLVTAERSRLLAEAEAILIKPRVDDAGPPK